MLDSPEEFQSLLLKAQCALESIHEAEAVRYLQCACKMHKPGTEDYEELILLASKFSSLWQAKYWASLINKAEQPNPLSPREGKLLRRVPPEQKLSTQELIEKLETAISGRLQLDSPSFLTVIWTAGRAIRKPAIALMRSYAYLQARAWDQALGDASTAAAFSARLPGRSQSWPRALAAISSAIEGKQSDNSQAALYMQRALEGALDSQEYAADIERLLRRIPETHSHALQRGGSQALELLLAKEAEDALPEFKKARPKYYYYYNWMRERVCQSCGQLPPAVVEKLIRIDATELDMLLTYPTGIKQQAQLLLDVYENKGEAAVMGFRIPLLTWREAEQLKAAHRLEAPPDVPEKKPLPSIPEAGTDHAEEDLDSMEPLDLDLD